MNNSEYDYEHERRFLVVSLEVLKGTSSEEIEQGYLWAKAGYAVRVRSTRSLGSDGELHDLPAFLTVKGPRDESRRWEQEMEIPADHAANLIEHAPHRIRKTRYGVISEGNAWVVDVFHDANAGLVIAEFEASAKEVAVIKTPWWCGAEVTQDSRYNNENLAAHPWPLWRGDEIDNDETNT